MIHINLTQFANSSRVDGTAKFKRIMFAVCLEQLKMRKKAVAGVEFKCDNLFHHQIENIWSLCSTQIKKRNTI